MAGDEHNDGLEIRSGLIRGNTVPYLAVQYYVSGDLALFEGDILLNTVDGIEQSTANIVAEMQEKGAVAITGDQYRWPEGIVPYTIDPALHDLDRVRSAISHWNEKSHIWLVARTNEPNYITFRPSTGCSSSVGMQGEQQFINLASTCTRGNAIHELGHAIGLWHEQSRSDRNLYVRILWQNIIPGKELNFSQQITDGDDIGPYDYGSIMHYSTQAFSRNNLPTIEARTNEPIGQRDGLSQSDIDAVNVLYPQVAPGKRL